MTGLLVAPGATMRWWAHGHALFQVVAWLLAWTIVCAAAVLAYPSPQSRIAGGEDRSPSDQVQEGPVTGVLNDERTVEVFAGIPYAQAPVGDLRWRAPRPLEPREEPFVADRFSAVPVQGSSTFVTRALSQLVEAPLEDTFLDPYPVSEDSFWMEYDRPVPEEEEVCGSAL